MQDNYLSLVIPCYNEADNIPPLIERLTRMLSQRDNIEVILVDNGSTDRTAEVLQKILAQAGTHSAIRMLTLPRLRRGYFMRTQRR